MPLPEQTDISDGFDNIDDTDYIFIVDIDGHLKSVLLPDGFEDATPPENITKILEIFDVGTSYSGTIH